MGTIVYARQSQPEADASPPTINDHWHVAYGFLLCEPDNFTQLTGTLEETDANGQLISDAFRRTGVHSHDDGVIHWHPSTSAAVGTNADLGSSSTSTASSSTTTRCGSPRTRAARSTSKARPSAATRTPSSRSSCGTATRTRGPGTTYTSDFDDIRITNDGMAITIAFVPRDRRDDAAVGGEPARARRGRHATSGQRPARRDGRPRRHGRPGATTVPGAATGSTDAGREHAGAGRDDAAGVDRTHRHRLMRAIVLVGGYGTRLRPLTDSIPKSMLPVAHVPLIARLIGGLERGGVDAVTLALGFRAEPFVEAFPGGRCGGVAIDYAVEPEPLDTAGAIRFAAEHAGLDETFVVANGDVLTDLDVGALVATHRATGAAATIHLTAGRRPVGVRGRRPRPGGRVLAFVEKPAPGSEPSNLINAGTYVFEPDVLDLIEPGRPVSVERDTFPRLVAAGRMYAMATDDYWIDAGRPELFLQANLDLVTGRRRERRRAGPRRRRARRRRRRAAAVIGRGRVVGAGATVTRSVVLPGATVGAGAVVEDSIVMGTVGDRARVVRAVVGAGAIIPDGESVVDARVPEPVG